MNKQIEMVREFQKAFNGTINTQPTLPNVEIDDEDKGMEEKEDI